MKAIYVLTSVFAIIAGVSTATLIARYQPAQPQDTAQQTASPTVITQRSPVGFVAAPSQVRPAVVSFERLPLCEQMDAIAKGGKSVAQFIADSGRYDEFAAHVKANCNWNAEQLQQANAILNPPVVTVQTIVRRQTVVEDLAPVRPQPPAPQLPAPQLPAPQPPITTRPWNNCNGIQEAGESYSVRCHKDQAWNDRHPHWPRSPHDRDNRVTDDFGDKGEANGYSSAPNASPEPPATESTQEASSAQL